MGTVAKTDTKVKEETECIAKCKAITSKWDKTDYQYGWEAIDLSIEFINRGHNTATVNRYWRTAWELDNDKTANNNRSVLTSRIANVANYFAYPKTHANADELYAKYKGKCGVLRIYDIIRGEEKRIADRMGKRMEKANNANKESAEEEAEALENVGNKEGAATIRNRAATTSKSNKRKKETQGWSAPTYNLDKEIKKNIKQLIQGEPQTFYRMIVSFSEIGVLSEEWGDLANKEMAKLG